MAATPLPLVRDETRRATRDLTHRLKKARRAAARRVMSIRDNPRLATNAAERERLYREVRGHYRQLAVGADRMLRAEIERAARRGHERSVEALREKGERLTRSVTRYDPKRARRYLELLTPENAPNLVATFTDRMATEDIRALRTAFLDTYRQSQLEGWTSREIHRRLQQSWDGIAHNMDANRFVDASGRAWTNADYLNMLTRTTLARTARESYVDTLVADGDELGIIESTGENCPVCDAWSGLVVSLTGNDKRYPSLKDAYAAGWGHPNCSCHVEGYVEAVDEAEGERQAAVDTPEDWTDRDQVQRYNDETRMRALQAERGLSREAADVALKREKLEHRMQVAFLGGQKDVIGRIPDSVLARIPQDQLPRFELSKRGEPAAWNRASARGGVVHVARDASGETILGQLGDLIYKTSGVGMDDMVQAINTMELPDSLERVTSQTSLAHLKKQDGYEAAKKHGDVSAADRIVTNVLKAEKIEELQSRLDPDRPVVFVPIVNSEANRRLNVLPVRYAHALKTSIDGTVESNVVKVYGTANTGAAQADRLTKAMGFDGRLSVRGAQVVIVDDNYTSGRTVMACMQHLRDQGADVRAVTTLATSRYGAAIKNSAKMLDKLTAVVGESAYEIERVIGRSLSTLTGAEVQSLTVAPIVRSRGLAGLERIYASADVP